MPVCTKSAQVCVMRRERKVRPAARQALQHGLSLSPGQSRQTRERSLLFVRRCHPPALLGKDLQEKSFSAKTSSFIKTSSECRGSSQRQQAGAAGLSVLTVTLQSGARPLHRGRGSLQQGPWPQLRCWTRAEHEPGKISAMGRQRFGGWTQPGSCMQAGRAERRRCQLF